MLFLLLLLLFWLCGKPSQSHKEGGRSREVRTLTLDFELTKHFDQIDTFHILLKVTQKSYVFRKAVIIPVLLHALQMFLNSVVSS